MSRTCLIATVAVLIVMVIGLTIGTIISGVYLIGDRMAPKYTQAECFVANCSIIDYFCSDDCYGKRDETHRLKDRLATTGPNPGKGSDGLNCRTSDTTNCFDLNATLVLMNDTILTDTATFIQLSGRDSELPYLGCDGTGVFVNITTCYYINSNPSTLMFTAPQNNIGGGIAAVIVLGVVAVLFICICIMIIYHLMTSRHG